MTDLKFKIAVDRITLDDLIDIEDGKLKPIRNIMANCLLGSDGEYLPKDEALAVIGKLTIAEADQAAQDIKAAMEAWKANALPPVGGARS